MNTNAIELNLNKMETVNGGIVLDGEHTFNWKESLITGGISAGGGALVGGMLGGAPGALIGGLICGSAGILVGGYNDDIWGDFSLSKK